MSNKKAFDVGYAACVAWLGAGAVSDERPVPPNGVDEEAFEDGVVAALDDYDREMDVEGSWG